MVLDTLENGVNIKRLVVQEPEKPSKVMFDPERDIPPEAWTQAISFVNSRKDIGLVAFLLGVYYLKEMSPKHLALLSSYQEDVNTKIDYFKHFQKTNNTDLFEEAQELFTIFPDAVSEVKLGDKECLLLQRSYNAALESKNYIAATLRLVDMKMFFPDKASLFPIPPDLFEQCIASMSHPFEVKHREDNLTSFANQLLILKALFPDRISEVLNDQAWETIHKGLAKMVKLAIEYDYSGLDLLQAAMYVNLLAADRIAITPTGLKPVNIIKQDSFQEAVPTQPELRRF